MFRMNSFQCFRPFGLRGKWPPIPAPVSPAPSKIPYGGFSPVRLQTSIRWPPSSAGGGLIGQFPLLRSATRFVSGYLDFRPIRTRRRPSKEPPVQWPLAPQPVVLSGRIIAYYGHI
jgi:hypothetical protein